MKYGLKNIQFVWKYFLKEMGNKSSILFLMYWISTGLSTYFTLIVPSKIIELLEHGGQINNQILYLAIWSVLLIGFMAVKNMLFRYTTMKCFLFRCIAGNHLLEKIIELPYDYVSSNQGKADYGNAREAVFIGNNQGIEQLLKMVLEFVGNVISFLIYSIFSVSLHPFIFFVLFLTSGIRLIKDIKNVRLQKEEIEQLEKTYFNRQYLKTSCIDNKIGKDGRIYSMKQWFEQQFASINERIHGYEKTIQGNIRTAELIGATGSVIKNVICYGYLMYRMIHGMSISQFVLYLGVINGVGNFTQLLFHNIQEIIKNIPSCHKYETYMSQMALQDIKGTIEVPKAESYMYELKDVSFEYEKGKPIISHLNLTIHAGEKIALVGENGAGKTTLIKLLIGLIKPNSGTILLNGKDISKMTPTQLFKVTTVVFQETSVFPATIRENIICGELIDKEKLQRVIKESGLDVIINRLPDKEDTIVTKLFDKEGIELSGGQYQRLMLARALYKNANVLILDEPTAALDPIAESELYEEYHKFTKEATSVFISHRLSSTKFCDRILFMQHGQIIEEGSHDMLMKQEGAYKKMFDVQAYYYKTEGKSL